MWHSFKDLFTPKGFSIYIFYLSDRIMRCSHSSSCCFSCKFQHMPDLSNTSLHLTIRLQLNKQVQQLEKYLRATSVNDERQKSHFSTSTAPPRAFQYETPPTSSFRADYMRSDAQSYICNGSNLNDRWNSFSSVDGFGASSFPVEREQYVPKYSDVNYIEGSNDKKWSSRDFPWTKKMEVCTTFVQKTTLFFCFYVQLMDQLLSVVHVKREISNLGCRLLSFSFLDVSEVFMVVRSL